MIKIANSQIFLKSVELRDMIYGPFHRLIGWNYMHFARGSY